MNESVKTSNAFKWSSITEILSKIISPIINMLLARILAPEAFGILATVTMVISFAEIFVESGFQKFLIQHQFESKEQENRYMSVAFWANLIFACAIWLIVAVFCNPLATLVGNDGLGYVIAIAGVNIPLYSLIGVQNCRLKKNLEFKRLFYVRIVSSLVPLVVTLPLALIGLDFWSLIIGNIAGVAVRSISLAVFGRFKPMMHFDFSELKHMLSYGVWTMLDGVAIWATNWVDSLLISHFMSDYYLGLYKNSVSTVTSLFSIITAAITPVLFASLARLQDDNEQFNRLFLKVQKMLATFLIPIGVGLLMYRELATEILFGNQWAEAANIIGIISLTTALRTVFISFYSDAYRAKGHFYISLIMQCFELVILIPACIISVKYGFWTLVYTRALLKLDLIIPEIIVVWKVCRISIKDTFKTLYRPILATLAMTMAIFALQLVSSRLYWELISIVIAIIVYFGVLFIFAEERKTFLFPIYKKLIKNKKL